jgi:hypothetical protein
MSVTVAKQLFSSLPALLAVVLLAGCGRTDPLQQHAEDYVGLALALDQLRSGEVDAWFGPAGLDPRSSVAAAPELAVLQERARKLLAETAESAASAPSVRAERLHGKSRQLLTVLDLLAATPAPAFADEARDIYGLTLPEATLATTELQQAVMAELNALLPGSGTLAFRVGSFRNKLLIPADKRRAVFERALAECRERTLQHWQLPAGETLQIEWTRDVTTPWHRYDGELRSTLQLNDLTLAFIGSALDVACHEGYPGHHAQFVLYEQAAGGEGLALEDQLVLLRSPESALREGAAELGVELVFPAAERLAFERDVLYPLAGLPPEQAETNLQISALLSRLAPVIIPVLQAYRDGAVTFNAATFELEREALVSSPAELLRFVDQYGAYSVSYTLMRENLRQQLQSASGDPWSVLAQALGSGLLHQ